MGTKELYRLRQPWNAFGYRSRQKVQQARTLASLQSARPSRRGPLTWTLSGIIANTELVAHKCYNAGCNIIYPHYRNYGDKEWVSINVRREGSVLPFFGLIDVRELLPQDWVDQIGNISSSVARYATLKGGTSTSLERADTAIRYRLVDGDQVVSHLPWLVDLYCGKFLQVAQQISGFQLATDLSTTSAVNINVLAPGEGGYEWHIDSNPVTGLLFLSSHLHHEGGMLELRSGDDHLLSIEPLAGTLAVFDARLCPHRVSAPKSGLRISAPMNYFVADEVRYRPKELDSILYGEHTSQ